MSRADRRVFNIPAGTGFLDALAEGVLAETGGDPFAGSPFGYRSRAENWSKLGGKIQL